MSQLEATVSLQADRAEFIRDNWQFVKDLKPASQPSCSALDARLRMLESYWEKFENTHEKIMAAGGKYENFQSSTYVTEKVFTVTLAQYVSARDKLMTVIDAAGGDAALSSTRRHSSSAPPLSRASRRALPEINLPVFDGSFSAWPTFRDLFTSLIIDNHEVSTVEKMHYLRTSLTGAPARLVSNVPIADDSFKTAWAMIVRRYENTRLLITAHLDQLFCSAPMAAPTADELHRLMSTVTESLGALDALNVDTNSWDPMLVHMLVRRLTPKFREAWENKLGDSAEFPTLAQLQEFLYGRARALESLAFTAPPSSTSGPAPRRRSPTRSAAKVHLTSAAVAPSSREKAWPVANRYPCSYCSGEHYISSCIAFGKLSFAARKAAVDKLYLCFNCLGKHSIRVCQTTRTCQVCHKRHHTLLHVSMKDARPSGTVIPVPEEQPRVATPEPSTDVDVPVAREASPARSGSEHSAPL